MHVMNSPEQPLRKTARKERVASPASAERTMAMFAHVLQIPFFAAGPVLIYFLRHNSRFVRFHALQAFLWQLSLVIVILVCAFTIVAINPPQAEDDEHWKWTITFFFATAWVYFLLLCPMTIFLGLLYGVQAKQGKWAGYPVIADLAWRWSS